MATHFHSTHALSLVPLLAMLAWAAVVDLKHRRIANWLTVSMMLSGLCRGFIDPSAPHIGYATLGLFAGAALPFVLFVLGALGGGDVKLLAGVGAWLGGFTGIEVFCLTAILGMMMVLGQAAGQGRLRTLTRNSAVLAINLVHVADVGLAHTAATGQSSRSIDKPLPYAVPVFAVVLMLWASAQV